MQNSSSIPEDQVIDLIPSNFHIAPKVFRYLVGKDKTSIAVIANSSTEAKIVLESSIEKSADVELLYDGCSEYIIDARNTATIG